jgi:uncharacterized protein YbaP (TraB family)
MRIAGVGAALWLAALSTGALAQTLPAPASPPLDEIVVTGEQPGPELWHVHGATGHLWFFGTVSPLPAKMHWRAKRLEQVVTGANQVMLQRPIQIGLARAMWLLLTQRSLYTLPHGRKLKDVVPPNLYARFDSERTLLGKDGAKWEKYRPLIAGLALAGAAYEHAGLTEGWNLPESARALARKHHVKIEEVEFGALHDVIDILKNMSPETENKCFSATLNAIDTDLPRAVERANAWATGDVEALQRLVKLPLNAAECELDADQQGGDDVFKRLESRWEESMVQHLENGDTTVVVKAVQEIIGKEGILEKLRAKGYTVDPI